jgi:hypothetical protein
MTMNRVDEFYTPSALAVQMAAIALRRPLIIADFASGDGELLIAASKRWKNVRLIGTDVSRSALSALRRNVPSVESGVCNFLSARSRSQCLALQNLVGRIDLVILNPPFSCRGGKRIDIVTGRLKMRCGVAMGFVLNAFEYLSTRGEIIAILPSGSFDSERDKAAWSQLKQLADVDLVSHHDHKTFGTCSPRTSLVHIRRRPTPSLDLVGYPKMRSTDQMLSKEVLVLQRGSIQMHDVPKGLIPLAHTTDLYDFRLTLNGHRTHTGDSTVRGPFVALSRVGAPRKDKLVWHHARTEIAISDCIIALGCDTEDRAKKLHRRLLDHWPEIEALYGGTGAKYITVSRLAIFLRHLGFNVVPHASATPQLARLIEQG